MTKNYGQLISDKRIITLKDAISTIGRHPDNTYVLENPSISKYHCIVEFQDNDASIIDKGSTHGVFVNQNKLPHNIKFTIKSGDTIVLGKDTEVYKFINFVKPLKNERIQSEDSKQSQVKPKNFDLLEKKPFRSSTKDMKAESYYESEKPIESQKTKFTFEKNITNTLENFIESLEYEMQGVQNVVNQKENNITDKENDKLVVEKNIECLKEKQELELAKQGALEKYIKELQKRLSECERQIEEKSDQIKELCDQEMPKNQELLNLETKMLDIATQNKKVEFAELQKYASEQYQLANKTPNIQALDDQAKEQSILKRKIVEFENRDNDCPRKWKDQFLENQFKDDDTKGLTLQLDRQSENYQQLYTEYDKIYFDKQNSAYNLLNSIKYPEDSDREQKEVLENNQEILHESSKFLIEVVQSIQQDTNQFLGDSNDLNTNFEELSEELNKQNFRVNMFESIFNESDQSDDQVLAASSLRTRIEELFDFSEELRHINGRQEISELNKLTSYLQKKLESCRTVNNKVSEKISKITKFNGSELKDKNTLEFFSKLLMDKEINLKSYQKLEEDSENKDKEYLKKIEDLEWQVQNKYGMNTNIKETNNKINELVMNGANRLQLNSENSPYSSFKNNEVFLQNEVVTKNNIWYDQQDLKAKYASQH